MFIITWKQAKEDGPMDTRPGFPGCACLVVRLLLPLMSSLMSRSDITISNRLYKRKETQHYGTEDARQICPCQHTVDITLVMAAAGYTRHTFLSLVYYRGGKFSWAPVSSAISLSRCLSDFSSSYSYMPHVLWFSFLVLRFRGVVPRARDN